MRTEWMLSALLKTSAAVAGRRDSGSSARWDVSAICWARLETYGRVALRKGVSSRSCDWTLSSTSLRTNLRSSRLVAVSRRTWEYSVFVGVVFEASEAAQYGNSLISENVPYLLA